MSPRLTALLVLLALASAGCGMRGQLYLPEEEPAAVPEAPAEPADTEDEDREGEDDGAGR